MKKIIIFLLFLLPIYCFADFDARRWEFFKDLSPVSGKLAKFFIDDEIFSQAKKDLSDLRVISEDGQEIPFKVITGSFEQRYASYPVKILNSSYQPGFFSMAILDLGEEEKIINNLTLETTAENFQRNVTLYGSDDMKTWNVLVDNAYIYDYTDKKGNLKAQNTTIRFPDNVFRSYVPIKLKYLMKRRIQLK